MRCLPGKCITVVAKSLGPPLEILIQTTNRIFNCQKTHEFGLLRNITNDRAFPHINHIRSTQNFQKSQYFVGPPLALISSLQTF